MIQDVESNLFESVLETGSQVVVAIGYRLARLARRAEAPREFIGVNAPNYRRAIVPGHVHAFRMMPKVIKIQAEPPFGFSSNQVSEVVDEARLSKRRQAHNLAFVAVVRKPEKLCRRRIQDAG